jgi:hypothetical protein
MTPYTWLDDGGIIIGFLVHDPTTIHERFAILELVEILEPREPREGPTIVARYHQTNCNSSVDESPDCS